jgi:2-polyprenyl-3-methyl-5-hydroxy-6-metoxy-1,4-benzoquinol methylase
MGFWQGLKFVCRPLVSPLRHVLERIPRGSRVFDIGCGAGGLLYLAASQRDVEVASGYDVSPEAVDAAKSLASISPGLQIEHRLPDQGVPDLSSADIVTLCDVLHHLPDETKVTLLKEVAGRMRPGAALIVADIDAGARFGYWMNQLHDLIVSKEWVAPVPAHVAHELIGGTGMTILQQERVRSIWYAHYLIVAEKPR